MLTHAQARRVYDRIGRWQDSQAFYEDPATSLLIEHADLSHAASVFEFGCGTGRFALRLLAEHLGSEAVYRGVDISPKMVQLARARLGPFAPRAQVGLSGGETLPGAADGSCDRVVSNYVLELLPADEVAAALEQAHRILRPGGLLCLTGITSGVGFVSRFVMGSWGRVSKVLPTLVGGCRPLDVRPLLSGRAWQVCHDDTVVAYGVASQVLVAARC